METGFASIVGVMILRLIIFLWANQDPLIEALERSWARLCSWLLKQAHDVFDRVRKIVPPLRQRLPSFETKVTIVGFILLVAGGLLTFIAFANLLAIVMLALPVLAIFAGAGFAIAWVVRN